MTSVPDGHGRLRRAEAAFALFIRRNPSAEREVLVQWNVPWQRYSLIGGRREAGESFRDCCLREVEEELGLRRDLDFHVAAEPLFPRCEYLAFSQREAVETDYAFEVFRAATVSASSLESISRDERNRWLADREIRHGATSDGAKIAEQTIRIMQIYPVG